MPAPDHTPSHIKSGSCLTEWQQKAVETRGEDFKLNFTLTDDGILTISGNTGLYSVPAPDAEPYYDEPEGPPCGWSEYASPFKDLYFHTAIIEDGVTLLGEECFKDCKHLKKMILPENMPVIRKNFAEGTSLEYTEKDGLIFLGPPSNPFYYLMGPAGDFNKEILEIPEGTVRIADEAFTNKGFIKQVKFPDTLEFIGWYTFDGTSIRHLFIPEGKLAFDETLMAFDGNPGAPLESVSLPSSMYKIYKEGKDTGLVEAWNRTCKIIYRNPDDSIAEILEPHPLVNFDEPETGETDDDWINSLLEDPL